MGGGTVGVGDAFPLEALPETAGGFRGPAVVYFYKAANTPTCTRQAVEFNRHYGEFAAAGLEVIGVSVDGADDQACFADDHGLRFPLVADPERAIAARLGILTTVPGHPEVGDIADRVTYLLDRDGVVRAVWQVDDVVAHPVEVLAEARRLTAAGTDAGNEQEPAT